MLLVLILNSFLLCLAIPQEEVSDNTTLKYYQQLLDSHGIGSDTASANSFLLARLPDQESQLEIAALIDDLSNPQYLVREAAEKKLLTWGSTALALLEKALTENNDTEKRYRASRCIRTINNQSNEFVLAAIGVLIHDRSESPTPSERLKTTFRLMESFKSNNPLQQSLRFIPRQIVDGSTKDAIREGTKHANRAIKIASIMALSNCFDSVELKSFNDLIADDDAEISLTAIKTIGFALPKKSVEHLINNLLGSDDRAVARQAASYLRSISGKYFEFRDDDSADLRQAAISRWQIWSSQNEATEKQFLNLSSNQSGTPVGFLVSVTSSKIQEYDLQGKLIWELDVPIYDAQYVNENKFAICERGQNRVRIIDRAGQTKLQIENIESPSDAQLLPNGHVLVLSGSGTVHECDSTGKVFFTVGGFNNPFDVDRLSNGNSLVADSGSNRLVEFDPSGKTIWKKEELAFPNNVFRLGDGRTLYTTYTSGIVVMLASDGQDVWRKELAGSTLYAVYCDNHQVYVADGANSKIWILNMLGENVREVQLPVSFCDVSFITK